MAEIQDEIDLPLRKPLAVGKGEVASLHLREPTAGEFDKFTRALDRDGATAATIALIAVVTGIERPYIEKLTLRDYKAASDFLAGFMKGSPEIGETPSPM